MGVIYRDVFLSTLRDEGLALSGYCGDLGDLDSVVRSVLRVSGKVFFSGVGKSGLVARKISATFSSTGTPSVFIHPVEAMHGDLGMMTGDDILIAISYSGESPELNAFLPHVKRLGVLVITFSKSRGSSLSSAGDYFLPIEISREACPLDTAPTTSTTLTMAMGDALAVCLMHARGFNKHDFAGFHPGGSLGRDLFLQVGSIMLREDLPIVDINAPVRDVILLMSEKRLGSAIFVDECGVLLGVLSDGDLRRAMICPTFSLDSNAFLYATKNPKFIDDDTLLAIEALDSIRSSKIQLLVVTDSSKKVRGVLHIHTLLQLGFKL